MPFVSFEGFDSGFGWVVLLAFAIQIVFVIGIIVLVALAIRWLIRSSRNDRYQPTLEGDDGALAVLRERYARGEIDAAEFEERKRTLAGLSRARAADRPGTARLSADSATAA
jgi:putative membrane protein